jgi:hypothetical protein
MIGESIEERGFAIGPGVLTLPDIEGTDAWLMLTALPRSRAGMRHTLRHPVVLEFAHDARLVTIAKAILGCDPFPFRATRFDKSPASQLARSLAPGDRSAFARAAGNQGLGPWSVKDGAIYAHPPQSARNRVVALPLHLDALSPHRSRNLRRRAAFCTSNTQCPLRSQMVWNSP